MKKVTDKIHSLKLSSLSADIGSSPQLSQGESRDLGLKQPKVLDSSIVPSSD